MKYSVIYIMAFFTMLVACTNEDDLTPSETETNYFAPSDSDHSETADIQRSFYSKNGCYLLFNDTLHHVQNGVDAYGNPIWNTELLDVAYPVVGEYASYYDYTYKYIKDPAMQKKVADYVSEHLAQVLGKGCPYSFLVVDSIYAWSGGALVQPRPWDDPEEVTPYPKSLSGTRCIAISIWNGKALTDEHFFDKIILDIAYSKLVHVDQDKLTEFYSYGKLYYSNNKAYFGYPQVKNDDTARKLGFWYDNSAYCFAYQSDDLKAFSDAACTYTTAEVEEMMKDYPLVIKRYKIIKDLLKSLGINLK